MLPSTGYFKGIICPFNDNGLCERPYCHYRHLELDESGAILQKLVSAAVIKALQQNDTSGAKSSPQHSQGDSAAITTTLPVTSSGAKATYNPTPIAELNKINSTGAENLEDPNEQRKRHIPVPYTPRKPAGLPIKRSVDINDPKPFIYNPPGPPVQYKPGCAENVQNDKYTPTGTVELKDNNHNHASGSVPTYKPGCTENIPNDKYTPAGTVESKEQYLPGTEKELPEYVPDTAQDSPNKINYVPSSEKNVIKNKILEYKPAKVAKSDKPTVTYQPTPRFLAPCFSSDEEPEPESKKRKLSSDLNGLDDLRAEFDILDQILDEEKPNEIVKNTDKDEKSSKDCEKNNGLSKSDKTHKSHKSNIEKSRESSKSRSDKKSLEEIKSKSDKKSADETYKSKSSTKSGDECLKEQPDKKSADENLRTKSEKRSSSESHRSKSNKKSEDNHKSKSDRKSSKDSHKSKDKKSPDKNHKSKPDINIIKDRKENKHEHKKSGHKRSSRDKEQDKKDSKEKHPNISKKNRSSSSEYSPSNSKHSSSKTNTESRSSRSSKEKKCNKEKQHKKTKDKEKQRSEDTTIGSDHDNTDTGLADEDYEFSDADEDAIALECKKIFEEYVPTEKVKSLDENSAIDNVIEEYIPGKKRVSRTMDRNIIVIPKAPIKPDFKVSAANAMAERLAKVREFHNSKSQQTATFTVLSKCNETSPKIDTHKSTISTTNIVPTKIRIAHVPYVSTMLNTKKTIAPSQATAKMQPSSSSTISQTIKKGAQRVAHMPSEKFIDRPGVLEPLASKIPANIRSVYLNMMIDECLKLYLSTHDAYARAQHEELATSKKCSTVPIYKNSAVLAVSRLRKELVECNGIKKSGSECANGKPDTSLKATNSGSWSIESKNRKVYDNTQAFSGAKFYENIKKWVLTEEQLQENCFPRPHESGQKGRAIIYGHNKQNPPKGYLRTCCRCRKEYTVNKKGFPVVKEECIYHPNRKYRVRGEAQYQCCSQEGTADGCCVAPSHVYEYVDFENLKGYVRTMPPERPIDDFGVYSLDCEMCYTTNGLDLTRVTVINSSCKVVYETLIKPLHPIIDYNTRYSGITEEQMANVKTTLLEVQATLLAMFSSKTILVGHSLESDFKALKLIHDTVIDTSVMFPHKMGPPFKRALRNLSSEYLKKIIQNSVDGHDSAEDAMVCMELLHYKLKEYLKTR